VIQWPTATTTTVNVATEDIFGQVWAWGFTSEGVEPRALMAELGYGTAVDPSAWSTWAAMAWGSQQGNNAEYFSNITPTATGVYSYAVRYNGNWGVGNPNNLWYYGDLNWDGTYDPADAGALTVISPTVTIELVKTVGADPLVCATTDIRRSIGSSVVSATPSPTPANIT
jgi:hypothetical protein